MSLMLVEGSCLPLFVPSGQWHDCDTHEPFYQVALRGISRGEKKDVVSAVLNSISADKVVTSFVSWDQQKFKTLNLLLYFKPRINSNYIRDEINNKFNLLEKIQHSFVLAI